jgi:hypothetical protein
MRTFSTNAPSSLGSLAASLQAIEAGKILDGRWDETLVGKEMLLDGRFHHQYVSKQTVNPLCRFDHQRWLIEPVSAPPQEITVEDALGWAGKLLTPEMRVVGQTFSLRRTCLGCGRHYPGLRLSGRLRAEDMTCRGCLEERVLTAGSDSMDYLTGNSGRPIRRMRLSDLGVLPHDILAVGQGDVRRYFEVGMLHEG